MWEPIAVPPVAGPVRAVSVPENGESLAVWTDDGVFRVRLTNRPAAFRMHPPDRAAGRFDVETGGFVSHGNRYPMTGFCGRLGWRDGPAPLTEHPGGDRLEVDREAGCVRVFDTAGRERLVVPCFRAADRPAVASFSRGWSPGWFLVVCDAERLRVFRHVREPAGGPARWERGGGRGGQQALLRAVADSPDDDTPRLVLADWLEESGDPERAELIRLQCRIAGREADEFVGDDDPDRKRERELIDGHGDRWAAELPRLPGVVWRPIEFRRGFPAVMVFGPASLNRQGEKIWAACPAEHVFAAVGPDPDLGRYAGCPYLDRARCLHLWGVGEHLAGPLRDLLSSPRVRNLRRLVLGSGRCGAAGARAVAGATGLERLEYLEFDFQEVGAAGARAVAGSPNLPRLRTVVVDDLRVSKAAKDALAGRFPNVVVGGKRV